MLGAERLAGRSLERGRIAIFASSSVRGARELASKAFHTPRVEVAIGITVVLPRGTREFDVAKRLARGLLVLVARTVLASACRLCAA